MVPPEIITALTDILDRVLTLAAEDAQLHTVLRQLAQAVLAATELPSAASEVGPQPPEELPLQSADREASPPHAEAGEPVPTELEGTPATGAVTPPLPQAIAANRATQVEAPPPLTPMRPRPSGPLPVTDADLGAIAARCRLKAEGARWAAQRRRLLAAGADFRYAVEPQDRDLIARARDLDCYLWVNSPGGPSPENPSLLEDLAGCFETIADSLELMEAVLPNRDAQPGAFENALDLLAEAQSALRAAVACIDGHTEPDQDRVFNWLKSTTYKHQVFIRKYMRLDDPADPKQWAELSARIDQLDSSFQAALQGTRRRKKLLSKVRHKASVIAQAPQGDHQDDWGILIATVDELVSAGVPPSYRDLRELLLPVIDSLPEALEGGKGFRLVLREIDRFLSTSPPPKHPELAPERAPEVQEAARVLGGKAVVLIGGDRRPAAQEALKEALGLRDLYWVETREHQSLEGFKPFVARPEVAVVLLAIRWASHSYGDVKVYCDDYGKPLVRLPGGYNPNQVARQILAQCGERLKEKD
jgi:hypothetical protein